MPIYIHCDICGRVMGETTIDKAKRFRKMHGERCDDCKRIYNHLDEFQARMIKINKKKLDALFEEVRNDVEHEIKRVVSNPPPKKTIFKWIKGLFIEEKEQDHGERSEREPIDS